MKISRKELYLYIASTAAPLLLIIVIIGAIITVIAFAGLYNKQNTVQASTNCITGVPSGLADIFTEAGNATNEPPALVAGIYLTEHWSNSFPQEPIDSETLGPSEISPAGARGPMQIMPSEWNNFVNLVKSGALPSFKHKNNPNIDRYYDSIYCSAVVIQAKLTEQPDTNRSCCSGAKPCNQRTWSDECVKAVGRAYCGSCNTSGCGNSHYNYCEELLRHYKDLSAPCADAPGSLNDVPCIAEDAPGHCGRASAAMVFEFYTRVHYSTTDWGEMGGTSTLNQRLTEKGINVQYVASQEPAKNDNWQKVINSINTKHPVIFFSRGFFDGPHIFVLTGYDSPTNTFIVNNPLPGICYKGVKEINNKATTKTNLDQYSDSQGGYYYYVQ